ncbi:hypothetical protein FBU30_009044 [Linnemannia zychae]|nr:hypothetical protein FBU30_009044 [Linnemannia zychae]
MASRKGAALPGRCYAIQPEKNRAPPDPKTIFNSNCKKTKTTTKVKSASNVTKIAGVTSANKETPHGEGPSKGLEEKHKEKTKKGLLIARKKKMSTSINVKKILATDRENANTMSKKLGCKYQTQRSQLEILKPKQ